MLRHRIFSRGLAAAEISASLLSRWHHAGPIEADAGKFPQPFSDDLIIPADPEARATPGRRVVEMARVRMALRIDDEALRQAVHPLPPVACLVRPACRARAIGPANCR